MYSIVKKRKYGGPLAIAKSARKKKIYKRASPRIPALSKFSISDLPYRKFAKMHMSRTLGISAAATQKFVFNIAVNDIYNPLNDAGANQPYGFARLMAEYTHFTVISANVKLQTLNASAYDSVGACLITTSVAGQVATAWTTGGGDGVLGALNAVLEMPHRSKILLQAAATGIERDRAISQYVDCAKFFGKTRSEYIADDTYSGAVAASPSRYVSVDVFGFSPYMAEIVLRYWLIDVDFFVMVSEPKYVAQAE